MAGSNFTDLRKVLYKMIENDYTAKDSTAGYIKFLTVKTNEIKEYRIGCTFDLDDAETKIGSISYIDEEKANPKNPNDPLKAFFHLDVSNGEAVHAAVEGDATADGSPRYTDYTFHSATSNAFRELNPKGLYDSYGQYRIYKVSDVREDRYYIALFSKTEKSDETFTKRVIKKIKMKLEVGYGMIDDLDFEFSETEPRDAKLVTTVDFTKPTNAIATHPVYRMSDSSNEYHILGSATNENTADALVYTADALTIKRGVETKVEGEGESKIKTVTSDVTSLALKGTENVCNMEFDSVNKSFRIFWETRPTKAE